jgi:D-sedoheptulose 7-phosphate isomerase
MSAIHPVTAHTAALYPFLASRPTDPVALLEDVRASSEAKTREIAALRDRLHAELGARLMACAVALAHALDAGGRLFTFGNGGSATDAQAVATLFARPPWGRPAAALALSANAATVTALANDVGFDAVYARQLAAYAAPGDVAVGLSTSGNSDNVIRALGEGRRRGLLTVGLSGYDGGRMAQTPAIDHLFVVPSASVHRIQEAQTTLYQVLWELTQASLATGGLRHE